jgi:hypothetical protein
MHCSLNLKRAVSVADSRSCLLVDDRFMDCHFSSASQGGLSPPRFGDADQNGSPHCQTKNDVHDLVRRDLLVASLVDLGAKLCPDGRVRILTDNDTVPDDRAVGAVVRVERAGD